MVGHQMLLLLLGSVFAFDVDVVGLFLLLEYIFQKQQLLLYGTIPSMIGVGSVGVVSSVTTLTSSTSNCLTVLVSVEQSSMYSCHLSESVPVKQKKQYQ